MPRYDALKMLCLPPAKRCCHAKRCLPGLERPQTEAQVLQYAGAPVLLSNIQELSLLRHQFHCARLESLHLYLVGHGEVLQAFTASFLVHARLISNIVGFVSSRCLTMIISMQVGAAIWVSSASDDNATPAHIIGSFFTA